jgi:glycosyltransferase involved in cell wall biosynthesis
MNIEKINMLYDATILVAGSKNEADRTGIFWVAYNILKMFSKDSRFNITLYINENVSIQDIKRMRQDALMLKFPIRVYRKDIYYYNIAIHKDTVNTTGNVLKKIWCGMKIIKNYLYIISNNNSSSLLKSIDIFFSPIYAPSSEMKKHPHIQRFIVLHDTTPVIFPQYFPEFKSDNYWLRKLAKSLDKNTYFFCNSECTKRDFMKYYAVDLDENKMIVTYISTSQEFYPDYNKMKTDMVFKKYRIQHKKNDSYIFSFCSLEPRKNLIFTIQCFIKFIKKHAIRHLYFYLGGTEWDTFIHEFNKKMLDFSEYCDRIVRLGYVDDKDVNILYSNALFFVYISQYEGFGMPPLEAMRAGTPVITSNNSSLPEIAGDAAIMIDYDSEDQCIKAFEDLYFNEELRRYYIEKGIERAKLFSWEKTAAKMTEVIIRHCNGKILNERTY